MKIISIKNQKDGSAIMTYKINEQDELLFKQLAKKRKKKYFHKFINSCILEGIRNYLKGEERNVSKS